jgi:phenylpropionate dioxygenase-like ring-hydroxylating dioxygenase large terminal subunit
MVFVHPDPAAAPLADHLGELPAHLGSFRPGSLSQVATASFDIACNWKLFVENHIDVYHLWYLHDRSLAGFDHTKFEHRHVGEHWTSYEPRRSAASEAVVPIGHLAQRDRDGLGAHLIFPNTMIATAAEFFATYVAEPVGPDRTRLDLRIRAEEGAAADAVLAEVRSFIDEDVAACEAVQEAIGSPAFAVGPLARDHEAPIVDFHVDLLRRLRRIEQDV